MTDRGNVVSHFSKMPLLVPFLVLSYAAFVSGNSAVYEPVLQSLQISVLQRHIKVSRHDPICVVLRYPDGGSKVESMVASLWEQRGSHNNCSQWQIAAFNVDKAMKTPLELPSKIPTLRCYLGLGRPLDFRGRVNVDNLSAWFSKLWAEFSDQLPEATVDSVEAAVKVHHTTVLGFSGSQKHYEAEEILVQVRQKWGHVVHVMFAHPHSPDVRKLAVKYRIKGYPAAVIIENSLKTSYKPKLVETLSSVFFSAESFETYLTARYMNAIKVDQDNFQDVILYETKHYVPMLVLFYSPNNPVTLSHLAALDRTIEDFTNHGIHLRYGLAQIDVKSKIMLEKWVDFGYTQKLPYTVLFNIKWKKTTVVGVSQYLVADRPTPSTIGSALSDNNVALKTEEGELVTYQPWGHTPLTQHSQWFEGPYGTMCYIHANNQTDHIPRDRPKLPRMKKKLSKKKETIAWHDRFGSETLEARLPHIGTLPVVTADSWKDVVEKSHAPSHPFNPGGQWRGEVTKVALVVFIMADCGSCRRNMGLFEELKLAVRYIDGGSLYVVNCTSDPELCSDSGVTGFPTLIALRGLGWLESQRCMTDMASMKTRYVRMDYHGPLMVKSVMDWFSVAAGQAVTNMRFQELQHETMGEDVRLIATVIPKMSRYLPHLSRRNQEAFYSYECLRLACELLYGQAACYVQYSQQIPQAEFDDEDQDMVVSMVEMWRRDGVSATIMQLGRSLSATLHEEATSSDSQLFHRPHRYHLPPSLKCEEDHAACTDLLVDFTRDHARMPVTHMTTAHFHTKNSIVFHEALPVLVALAHHDNITREAEFLQTIQGVAEDLYNQLVVVTVDVDQYPAWAGQFVPRDYGAMVINTLQEYPDAVPLLYMYPRLCVVYWEDHNRAAFYPPLNTNISPTEPFFFNKTHVEQFLQAFLDDPQQFLVTTEHF